MKKNHILETIGNTPCILYQTINENEIYLKLEMFNLGGSIKDRVVCYLLLKLLNEGIIKPDDKIVEATSGNTGIALALIGGILKIDITIIMPNTCSVERINLVKAYGGKVILCDGGIPRAIEIAHEYESRGYFYFNQFEQKANIEVHEKYTAIEILNDFSHLDYLVAGIGTGGTITGISHILKPKWSDLKIIGIEPDESAVISHKERGIHGIQGIGAGFIPPLLDLNYIDEIITIKTSDCFEKTNDLAKSGLLLGPSSAAAILGAEQIAKKVRNKKILVIAPDRGERYLSTEIFK